MTDRERAIEKAQAALPAVEVLAQWFYEASQEFAPAHLKLPWRKCSERSHNVFIGTAAVVLGKLDQRVVDLMLEAEASGFGGASAWLFVQSTMLAIDDPRRQAYEHAAAEMDLHAADIRAQKATP